jgi:hypothetical protein
MKKLKNKFTFITYKKLLEKFFLDYIFIQKSLLI